MFKKLNNKAENFSTELENVKKESNKNSRLEK